jgi:hypothetical protein
MVLKSMSGGPPKVLEPAVRGGLQILENYIKYSFIRRLQCRCSALGSWVRIPLKAWLFVCAFILFSLSCLQVAVLRRTDSPSKESYRLCKKDYATEGEARAQLMAVEPLMNERIVLTSHSLSGPQDSLEVLPVNVSAAAKIFLKFCRYCTELFYCLLWMLRWKLFRFLLSAYILIGKCSSVQN